MADVVLKLDADAARYVSEIVKAAERTKGLGAGAKEAKDEFTKAGDVLEAGVAKLGRMVSGASLLATGSAVVSSIYKDWVSHIDRASASMKALDDRMRGAASSAGEIAKLGAAKNQIAFMNSPLDMGSRATVFNANRAANPSATVDQGVAAVAAAGKLNAIGMEAGAAGTAIGKLQQAGAGDEAAEYAAVLHQRTGENAGAAADQLADVGMLPGHQMATALPLITAAGRTRGGLGATQELLDQYRKRRVTTPFAEWASKASRFQLSEGNREAFDQLTEKYQGEANELGNGSQAGYLEGQVNAVRKDPIERKRLDTEATKARTDAIERQKAGAKAAEIEALEAHDKEQSAQSGKWNPRSRRLEAFVEDLPEQSGVHFKKPKQKGFMGLFEDMLGESKKQTQMMKPRPAVGTQGE